MNKKHISILGSTGSIGTQAIAVIENQPDLTVDALVCGKNSVLMEAQVRRLRPALAVVWDENAAKDLKQRIADTETKVSAGMEGVIQAATLDSVDTVLAAMVGMIGIEPVVSAIKARKTIALANKETLVCAGHIIMPLAREYGAGIIPVDSEHSAIFQSMEGRQGNSIRSILLTASGGPFFGKKKEELAGVTAADALKHPNWSMGAKITIDSATLVNKGLEVIEACHLFDVAPERIRVLIHRQSILHSAVEYDDGAIIGQMGTPDMRLPIAYALMHPQRRIIGDNYLSLTDIGSLTFEQPDTDTFRGLALSLEAISRGGNMPAVLNAANEAAVARFLRGEIPFLRIAELIEEAMDTTPFIPDPDLEDILALSSKETL